MAELDRQIAEEKATIEGKTRVSEWRAAKRYLLDLDMDKLWAEATIDEQREALSIFRSITATPEGLAFEVPDLAVGFEIALQTGRSAVVEVAGPGLEPGTPRFSEIATGFSGVADSLHWYRIN